VEIDVHGIDAMQALWIALEAVYKRLRPFQEKLTWLGDRPDGEILAPIPFMPFDFEMQRHFEDLLERETTAYVQDRVAQRGAKRHE
jgi:hypothetical protein